MKKILFGLSLISIILFVPVSCEKPELSAIPEDADYFAYGTSFGECIGYCVRDIKMIPSMIEFTKNGWDLQGKLLEVKKLENIEESFWNNVADHFDLDAFTALEPVIGCPDCADGGAEWIEVKTGDLVYKVTFEYGNEPDVMKNYINYLRAYMDAFFVETNQKVNLNERVLTDRSGIIRNFTCSDGCDQFLVGMITGTDTTYYFEEYLNENMKADNLRVTFNGVLQYDSTTIYKPGPADEPVVDFKAQNIRIFGIKTVE